MKQYYESLRQGKVFYKTIKKRFFFENIYNYIYQFRRPKTHFKRPFPILKAITDSVFQFFNV